VNFHGDKRSNDTHRSSTDPDARLATRGNGQEAKLFFMGHVVMENRQGRTPWLPRAGWVLTFALAAYNLIRIRNLSAVAA
jgi:hypothetical protein